MERSVGYTLRFVAILGVVASAVVATVAVVLDSRQEANRLLDQRRKVLDVVGLSTPDERLTPTQIAGRFTDNIVELVIELETGEVAPQMDPETFDQRRASQNPETSRPAPENSAGVARLPTHVLVYQFVRDDEVSALVLPFEGVGLWSTIYGFIALSADLSTVRGITFYDHAETAGLGALISDPGWRALWEGRRMFSDDWEPTLGVVKGRAGPPDESPYEVDGISGATLTGNGVTEALRFWLGESVLGAYLARYREEREIT